MQSGEEAFEARRAPYGARGLKYKSLMKVIRILSRAPYGARGLKCKVSDLSGKSLESRPIRGAWIEMSEHC